jgi:hypothetical protein
VDIPKVHNLLVSLDSRQQAFSSVH